MGFTIEDDLNTERSRELWLEWKRRTDPAHFPTPATVGSTGRDDDADLRAHLDRADAGWRAALAMAAEGLIDPEHLYGTINCNAVNTAGHICGVTTTSGLAWKIPGRVGDSPIL